MKNFYGRLITSLIIFFGLAVSAPSAVSADPADVFPSGPYTATLISAKILYPSLFGVAAGLPVADVTGVQLSNGTTRAYVFAQNKGIVIADSQDGINFTPIGNAFGSDRGQGMPRVVKLSDGRFRMYNMTSYGVSCSISPDGSAITFSLFEKRLTEIEEKKKGADFDIDLPRLQNSLVDNNDFPDFTEGIKEKVALIPKPVNVIPDILYSEMTIADYAAIMWKKPVSNKQWLNELITKQ